MGDDRQPLLDGLRDQQSIEWIAVMRREVAQPFGVGDRDWQFVKASDACGTDDGGEVGGDFARGYRATAGDSQRRIEVGGDANLPA